MYVMKKYLIIYVKNIVNMAQKIEIKIEQAFFNSRELYFCLYVDDKFISCPWRVADSEKRGCKTWLKESFLTKNVQDALRFKKEIDKGDYIVDKTGAVVDNFFKQA